MKKLFTLTSDNGDRLKIRVKRNDDLSWGIDEIAPDFGCKPDISEILQPKFSKGDWCYHVKDNYIFRVVGTSQIWLISDSYLNINPVYCRHTTTGEIINHLRTTANVKYIGKCVNGLEWKCAGVITSFREYNRVTDTLYYNSGDVSIAVYRQGEWAEIVPAKKRLPMQKKAFRETLESFANILEYKGKDRYEVLNEFLEQYED